MAVALKFCELFMWMHGDSIKNAIWATAVIVRAAVLKILYICKGRQDV